MAWHVFEKLLEGAANYSTFIGKIWITFLFIFRIIMVASVGDTVYSDEQSAFACNTLQPGCPNICFNQFSPISQIRFWAVQILFVGTPSVVFIVFAMHKMSTLNAKSAESIDETSSRDRNSEGGGHSDDEVRRRRKAKNDLKSTYEKSTERSKHSSGKVSLPQYEDVLVIDGTKRPIQGLTKSSKDSREVVYDNRLAKVIQIPLEKENVKRKTVYHKDGSSEVVKTPSIARAYLAHAVIRMLVEIIFLVLQYYMYEFEVKELYVCEGFPCPKKVDCFVSRPKEKTLFLRFMYAMTLLSIVLNIIELVQLIKNFCCKRSIDGYSNNTVRRLQAYLEPRDNVRPSRRRRQRRPYPELGPFPRTHANSFSESDGNSMSSDYRYYA